jgi:hypothetical protein
MEEVVNREFFVINGAALRWYGTDGSRTVRRQRPRKLIYANQQQMRLSVSQSDSVGDGRISRDLTIRQIMNNCKDCVADEEDQVGCVNPNKDQLLQSTGVISLSIHRVK